MEKTEDIEAFVEKVIDMRRLQKEFFRTRRYPAMEAAKKAEKVVDDLAARLRRSLGEVKEDAQPELFGGADA